MSIIIQPLPNHATCAAEAKYPHLWDGLVNPPVRIERAITDLEPTKEILVDASGKLGN